MKRTILVIFALILTCMLAVSCSGAYAPMGGELAKDDYDYEGFDGEPAESNAKGSSSETAAKVIRTVSAKAETLNFDRDYETLKTKLTGCGGRFESVSVSERRSSYDKPLRTAYMTLRVPQAELDKFVDEVSELLNVTAYTENSKDVTGEYVDIAARLETMEAQRKALTEMLEKADNVQEMLLIQERLYNVIADIEAYQARLNHIDSQAADSTVSLELIETKEYTPVEEVSFGQEFLEAIKEGGNTAVTFVKDTLVFLAKALPVLTLIFLIPGIVVLIVLLSVKSKKKKALRAKSAEEKKDPGKTA